MGFKRKGSQTSRNDVLPDLHIATASSVKGIAPTKNLASSPQHGKGRICREDRIGHVGNAGDQCKTVCYQYAYNINSRYI